MKQDMKTTISGLIGAVGAYLATLDNPTLKMIGQILTAIGIGLLGYHSTDK
jgi:hypothetical protein